MKMRGLIALCFGLLMAFSVSAEDPVIVEYVDINNAPPLTAEQIAQINKEVAEATPKAEAGDAAAQFIVGTAYLWGQGGKEQSYSEAMKWLRKAADQGEKCALYQLGCIYNEGYGVEKDEAEALKWFLKGAEAGHPNSQYMAGFLLSYGETIPRDPKTGVKWIKKAADNGHPLAKEYIKERRREFFRLF